MIRHYKAKIRYPPPLSDVALRFGLNRRDPKHVEMMQGLIKWWENGMRVGDKVWLIESILIHGEIVKLGKPRPHLLCPSLTLSRVAGVKLPVELRYLHRYLDPVTYYDVDGLLPSAAWVKLQMATSDRLAALSDIGIHR